MDEAKSKVEKQVEEATIPKTSHRIAMQIMVSDPSKYKERKYHTELTDRFWSRFKDAEGAKKTYSEALAKYENYSLLHCVHEDYASMSLFEDKDAMTSDQFYEFLEKGAPKKVDESKEEL